MADRALRLFTAVTMLACAALVTAGCGSDKVKPAPVKSSSKVARGAHPQTPEAVIKAWADAARTGDTKKAARYFAIPSIVSNDTKPVKLKTRADAEFFNETLPCGAKVAGTRRVKNGYVLATFVLTNRPGAKCGSGVGGVARVAIRVREGKITDWRRASDLPQVETQDA